LNVLLDIVLHTNTLAQAICHVFGIDDAHYTCHPFHRTVFTAVSAAMSAPYMHVGIKKADERHAKTLIALSQGTADRSRFLKLSSLLSRKPGCAETREVVEIQRSSVSMYKERREKNVTLNSICFSFS
jgi:hypothetical protein